MPSVTITVISKDNNPTVFSKTHGRKWGKSCSQQREPRNTHTFSLPCWPWVTSSVLPKDDFYWLLSGIFPSCPSQDELGFQLLLYHSLRQLFHVSLLRVKALLKQLWGSKRSPSTPTHWSSLQGHPHGWEAHEPHWVYTWSHGSSKTWARRCEQP